MLYIETKSTDPTWNLAFEEVMQEWDQPENIMMLWQNKNAIIVGRYQNSEKEINFDAANEISAKVVRRSSGGGTVYHDLGNLNYTFIRPMEYLDSTVFSVLSKPMVEALNSMGIPAISQGRNDITLDGKKISGTAQRIHHKKLMHHGTLLFDSDLDNLQSVLNVNAAKIISKGISSVRSRVTNIKEHVSEQKFPDIQSFWKALIESFSKNETLTSYEPSGLLLEKVKDLQESKYQTWDWNFGKAPAFEYHNSKRFPGGNLEINLNVEEGLISSSRICGDFMGLIDLDKLESSLIGVKYDAPSVLQRIRNLELSMYLGSISAEEFVTCMFDSE
jgi:lipoate---protein ligase